MNFVSWKTTIAGIVLICTGVGAIGKFLNDILLGHPVSFEEVGVAVVSISSGIGMIFARDNDKSSQDAGVR